MAVFLGAFPVLPGKEDEVRKFTEETNDRILGSSVQRSAAGDPRRLVGLENRLTSRAEARTVRRSEDGAHRSDGGRE